MSAVVVAEGAQATHGFPQLIIENFFSPFQTDIRAYINVFILFFLSHPELEDGLARLHRNQLLPVCLHFTFIVIIINTGVESSR